MDLGEGEDQDQACPESDVGSCIIKTSLLCLMNFGSCWYWYDLEYVVVETVDVVIVVN